ncbi:MAG: hypothetical protein OSB41_09100 [Kiritimatiellae bacterium]|nr:hypothetical protein [Kiritimatiellia bacterium]
MHACLQQRIDVLDAQLAGGAAERNFKRWPLPPGDTHAKSVAQLRDWITARLVLPDDHFGVDEAP